MGCCAQSLVADFTKVNNKNELKICFNKEMNRLKILQQTMIFKLGDEHKNNILHTIIHEHCWMILALIEALDELHVIKIKFLLFDYFKVTENWNRKEFDDNFIKIMNFKKDHFIKCEILLLKDKPN